MIMVLGIGGTHLSGFQMSVINYTSPVSKAFIKSHLLVLFMGLGLIH